MQIKINKQLIQEAVHRSTPELNKNIATGNRGIVQKFHDYKSGLTPGGVQKNRGEQDRYIVDTRNNIQRSKNDAYSSLKNNELNAADHEHQRQ